MEKIIKKYINDAINHPLENLYESATNLFGVDPLPGNSKIDLVVPKLAEIPTAKRRLIKDIVFLKTNYNIAASGDAFSDSAVIMVDKVGERK